MTHTPFTRRLRRRPRVEILEGRALLTAGALDTTFGGTGMVATTIGSFSGSNAVAVQSDSKVVVVGWSSGKNKGPFTVARYNTNGSLDSTFGSGGVVVVPIGTPVPLPFNPNDCDEAFAVAIQPADGKILVAGTSTFSDKKNPYGYYSDFAIARLNPNGALDTTFGGGKGYVMTQVSPELTEGRNYAESIVLQPNGQIVVGGALEGQSVSGTIDGLALVRYNTNGSLDTAFGTGGEVVNTNISPSYPGPMTMAMDGSGRIDAAGQLTVGTAGSVVARYLANGTLDSTFGTGGVAGPLPLGFPQGVGLQSTGQIVVYGLSSNAQATLVRLNTNGSIDSTFGTNGVYTDSRMNCFDSIVIQPTDDKIVAVGQAYVNGQLDQNFWVTRVLAGGSAYDSTFGTNGLAEANFNNYEGLPTSVALDPDGRILVTGSADQFNGTTYSYYFATARFLGDSTSMTTALATTGTPLPTTASASDPILGALVLSDPTFLDSLPSGKHRRLS
jgi:uncharacterized delta-60 repeat protein